MKNFARGSKVLSLKSPLPLRERVRGKPAKTFGNEYMTGGG
jgi:hypothetical protein